SVWDSEEEEDDSPSLGPLQRLSNALKTKQQHLLARRRHPTLEWKEVARWHAENAAGWEAAEQERQRQEVVAAEKVARRERKTKRKAQRKLTKQKDLESRALLHEYEVAVAKSDKRTALLTQFAVENRIAAKQALAAAEAARQAELLRESEQRVILAEARDKAEQQAVQNDLQRRIEHSNELGRRCGLLPAIRSSVASPPADQDETSTILILRVNNVLAGEETRESPTPSGTGAMAGKRQFFTANLKRFKHAEQLQGERIGDHGAKELARSLVTGACPRIRSMHLGWNLIKYSGVAALADCFTRGACGQLEELDLRCNSVDAKAFATLLTALEKGALPELLDIRLQGNVLGDDGARALAHALLRGTLRALRHIDVRQNRMRNDGVLALWNVFTSPSFRRFCPKLQLLDMRRNEAQGVLTRTFCPCPSYLEF
ncbi:hypothetical protein BBJ28_00019263, partial [Nothophytophthora sp. Chile5]